MAEGAGLRCNNYIGSRKVKNMFKGLPYNVDVKNIRINGQIRGCSGFIVNQTTNKVCYITTEPFFDGEKGSGLFNNINKAIMMRTAKDTRDYKGGFNQWLHPKDIVSVADRLTGGT